MACLSVASILENTQGPAPSATLLLHDVNAPAKDSARRFLASYELDVDFVDVDGRWCEPWASARGQPQAKFGILRFDDFLKDQPDRILMIDADTRFVADIAPLLHMDLADKPLAAVDDSAVISDGRVGTLTTKLGLPKGCGYFNAGFLVVDVANWINNRIGERAISVLRERPEILTFNDQCALNAVVGGQYVRLGFRWNHLVGSTPSHWPAAMYHYAGYLKPWNLYAARNRPVLSNLVSREHFEFYQEKNADMRRYGHAIWQAGPVSAIGAHLRLNNWIWSGEINKFQRRQTSPDIAQFETSHPQLVE